MYTPVAPGEEVHNPLRTRWETCDEGDNQSHILWLDTRPFGKVYVGGGTVRSVVVSGDFTEDGKRMSVEPNEGYPEFTVDEACASLEVLRKLYELNY